MDRQTMADLCWSAMQDKLSVSLKQVPFDTRHAAEKFIAVSCPCD